MKKLYVIGALALAATAMGCGAAPEEVPVSGDTDGVELPGPGDEGEGPQDDGSRDGLQPGDPNDGNGGNDTGEGQAGAGAGGSGGQGGVGGGNPQQGGGGGAGLEFPVAPVQPDCWVVPGNPRCEDVGTLTHLIKIDPPVSGDYAFGQHEIDLVTDGNSAQFTSTRPVDVVIIKGGPAAMVCEYPDGTIRGRDLHAPEKPGSDETYDISHLTFCVW